MNLTFHESFLFPHGVLSNRTQAAYFMREAEATPTSRWVDEVAAVVASLLIAAVAILVLVRRYYDEISQCFRPSNRPNARPTDRPADQGQAHTS